MDVAGVKDAEVRALLLDYQGVITERTSKRDALYQAVEQEYGIKKRVLKTELARLGLAKLGAKELAQVIDGPLSALLGRAVEPHDWYDLIEAKLIDENVRLTMALKSQYRISIVANSNGTVEERIRRTGIRDLFDDVIDSQVVGIEKPDLGIYYLAASRLGLRPEECLFIDDKPENVEGAHLAGMKAFVFRQGETPALETLLAQAGIRVPVAF